MNIMLIHPGDSFSTADVYDGLMAGLRANGHTITEARLDYGLDVFSTAAHLFDTYAVPVPPWAADAFALAAPRIIAQAAWERPDLVIAVTGLKLHPSVPLTLRRMGIATALLCTESPYEPVEQQIAPYFDHVFTHERKAVALFGAHPSVHYLPHAYNPLRHHVGAHDPAKASDVYFVGTAFPERRALFAGVNWSGITFRCDGSMWHIAADAVPDAAAIASGAVDPWAGVQENADVAAYYRSAKICLNHHRTTTRYGTDGHIRTGDAESLGPRAYEIAACGAFQLCDDSRPELFDLFGDAAATYHAGDSADLEQQIRFWLAHPGQREFIRYQQMCAVQRHSWRYRAASLLNAIPQKEAVYA